MRALAEVAESATLRARAGGGRVREAFAAYAGAQHCIGVNTGTSALHLALIAAGVGPGGRGHHRPDDVHRDLLGDQLLSAPRPVFVDVDPVDATRWTRSQVAARITARTKAILPVHLYGQPADMGPLLEIGRRRGIPVIEDAAQAHWRRYGGRAAGTLGLCGCFSFYPGKNLGACGEGGAVVTDDDALAARLRSLRDHAQSRALSPRRDRVQLPHGRAPGGRPGRSS